MHSYVLAVTTYNRLPYLRRLLETWERTRGPEEWKLIVADDGSTDGTKEFLRTLDATVIYNDRRGVAHQTNTILQELSRTPYDLCFKCDDDLFFLRKGWDKLYHDAIQSSGFQHLCFEDPRFNEGEWCKNGTLASPVYRNGVFALMKPLFVKGCFYTVTPEVQNRIGYMDTENFFHGLEHTDFTMRAARAGFNDERHIFDAQGSNDYLSYPFHYPTYAPALENETFKRNSNGKFGTWKKLQMIFRQDRIHVPFRSVTRRMNDSGHPMML